MKKVLSIIAMIALVAGFVFATNDTINITLKSTVGLSTPTFKLTHASSGDITSDTDISGLDITTAGNSGDFQIKTASAYNIETDFNGSVTIGTPKGLKFVHSTSPHSDHEVAVTPSKETIAFTLSAGKGVANESVGEAFNFSWDGNENLKAGDYTCTIAITYTAS